MKDIPEYEKDLACIRTIMERSAKFLSLSGLSGVLAGVYALVGATAAYFIVHYPISPFNYRIYSINDGTTLYKQIFVDIGLLWFHFQDSTDPIDVIITKTSKWKASLVSVVFCV
jgi:hypothetical protein